MHLAVALLSTRVKKPNESDWKKLKRLLMYLNGTRGKFLTLRIDELGISIIKRFIDASFAVHPDFKSHTGAMMTKGKGTIIPVTRKQKLNTRSSTESEIVGVDDCSVYVSWS